MATDPCLDDAQLLALIDESGGEASAAAHVDQCAGCRQRLAGLRRDMAILQDTAGAVREAAGPAPLPPRGRPEVLPAAIGPYRVLEWLGRGGEADVFRAEHPVLRREVALKWSKRSYEGDAEPLVEEGRLLASLEVEGVARVFDVGVHEGRPYLVMQMLRGRTLHRHAAEASPSPREVARLVAQVARILSRAHAHQVWHGDLKPSNVVIDGEGRPTVIDFGMASFCQPWNDDAPCSGGTLQYMSPEQAKNMLGVCDEDTGGVPAVGPRTDIFALGAMLYSLLTGHTPYPRSGASPELIEQVCRGGFDRRRLAARGIPKRLRRICLRAMAYDPADRYATADALADELERFARAGQRNRRLLISAAMVLMIAAAAGGFVAWQGQQREPMIVADQATAGQTATKAVAVPVDAGPEKATAAVEIDSPQTTTPDGQDAASEEPLNGKENDKGRHRIRPHRGSNDDEKPNTTKRRRWIPRWLGGRGEP